MATKATDQAVKTLVTQVELEESTLTAQDRCDKCQAQAYYRIILINGDLLLCSHDYKKNESVLIEQALEVFDESARLMSK